MTTNLYDTNHQNTMIRVNKAEKKNVNEHETIQNNKLCRYRRPAQHIYTIIFTRQSAN